MEKNGTIPNGDSPILIPICIYDIRGEKNDDFNHLKPSLQSLGAQIFSLQKIPAVFFSICLIDGKKELIELKSIFNELKNAGCKGILAVIDNKVKIAEVFLWDLLNVGVNDVYFYEKGKTEKCCMAKIKRWLKIEDVLSLILKKDYLIGKCKCWLKVLKEIIEFAIFSNGSGLILGESGTGKEMIAQLIHDLDKRQTKNRLVLLDCTTISPELSGSEFYGHERGAFTNAIASRDGAFALADEGTLFLDEVGELPMTMQSGLLRVIQEKTYKRVGSNNWRKTEFRLICATHRDLLKNIKEASFRQDLYYRIANWTFKLPSLNERLADIPLLVNHFFQQYFNTANPPPISRMVMAFLIAKDYPGNIRELRHLVRRIASKYAGEGPITIGDIPASDRQSFCFDKNQLSADFENIVKKAIAYGMNLREIKEFSADATIKIAIKEENGSIKNAAKKLEVTERAIQHRFAEKKKVLKETTNPS